MIKKQLIPKSCNAIINARNDYCGGFSDLNGVTKCIKRNLLSDEDKELLIDCTQYFNKHLMGTYKDSFIPNNIGPSLIKIKDVKAMVLDNDPLPTVDDIETSFFNIKSDELSFKDLELLTSVAAITVTIASTTNYIISSDSKSNNKLNDVITMSFYAFTSGDDTITPIAIELYNEVNKITGAEDSVEEDPKN